MTKLTPTERLIIAQAFYKKIAALVETKNADNLRGAVDAHYGQMFEEMRKMGAAPKTFKLELFGHEVGTYSITTKEAKPETTYTQLQVADEAALLKWAKDNGFMKVDWDAISDNFDETGEVPDGCAVVEIVQAATEGGGIKNTTLRIHEDEVIEAIAPMLPEVSRALLEGEGEDDV